MKYKGDTMYNYIEYKKMKKGVPTCGECKLFLPKEEMCALFTTKHTEEHYTACTKFDSHYEG